MRNTRESMHRRLLDHSLTLTLTLVALGGCSARAPEPLAVTRVRALKIVPTDPHACPGSAIAVRYIAVLDDATLRPIEGSSVRALDLSGVGAQPRSNGSWDTEKDPLISGATGFHLHAALHDNTAITADTIVVPRYDCYPTSLSLNTHAAPYPGPDVSVRVSQFRSPFYDSIVVIAVNVEDRPTVHMLLAPSQLRRGAVRISASGRPGPPGRQGADGASGNSPCADGGDGGDGTDGEAGANGGTFSVYVQAEHQGLLDLIEAANSGGAGGAGGRGGYGGRPGPPSNNPPCSPRAGRGGLNGKAGANGSSGPAWRVRALPLTELWEFSPTWADDDGRKALSALIEQTLRRRAPYGLIEAKTEVPWSAVR